MATSSIFHNIVIDNEEDLIKLINSLEEAEKIADTDNSDVKSKISIKKLASDDIRTLLFKQMD